jgi:hypothetical protein
VEIAAPLWPVFELYLADLAARKISAQTLANYTTYLKGFADRWPGLLVKDLRPYHLTTWLNEHLTWAESSRATAVVPIHAALNWAASPLNRIIPENPLRGMPR